MFCMNCGKEINDTANYCHQCGKEVSVKKDTPLNKTETVSGDHYAHSILNNSGVTEFAINKSSQPRNPALGKIVKERSISKKKPSCFAIGCSLVIILFSIVSITTWMETKKENENRKKATALANIELQKAGDLWEKGEKEKSANLYQKIILSNYVDVEPGDYEKTIEYYLETDDQQSVDKLINKAMHKNIDISLKSEKGKALLQEHKEKIAEAERKIAEAEMRRAEQRKEQKDAQQLEIASKNAYVWSMVAVKEKLKSPKSAEFPVYAPTFVTKSGTNQYSVTAYVDAQNSFGALIRTIYSCNIECEGNCESEDFIDGDCVFLE